MSFLAFNRDIFKMLIVVLNIYFQLPPTDTVDLLRERVVNSELAFTSFIKNSPWTPKEGGSVQTPPLQTERRQHQTNTINGCTDPLPKGGFMHTSVPGMQLSLSQLCHNERRK